MYHTSTSISPIHIMKAPRHPIEIDKRTRLKIILG